MAANTGTGSSRQSYAVAPHDINAMPIGRALLVGVGGDVTGRLVGDSADMVFKLPQGIHALQFAYIRATGTTATNMIILF